MKRLVVQLGLFAASLSVLAAVLQSSSAQPANHSRRITSTEARKLHWPAYHQVKTKTSVPQVKAIQFLLRNRGFYKSQPDGIFGSSTAQAARAFQRANKLKVDGIVGAQTWPTLLLRLKKGDRGDAVRALQIMLRQTTGHEAQFLTPDLPVDGIFGAQTEKALRIAQEQANWFEKRAEVDGIAGPQIWSLILLEHYQP